MGIAINKREWNLTRAKIRTKKGVSFVTLYLNI